MREMQYRLASYQETEVKQLIDGLCVPATIEWMLKYHANKGLIKNSVLRIDSQNFQVSVTQYCKKNNRK